MGIGGADNESAGSSFVSRHSLTHTQLFDEDEDVWDEYRIAGQPAGVVLDSTGNEIYRFSGPVPQSQVLEAIA